ncbi:MAG: efflux RND transporter periplasmic adaptor subunit [Magnetococcales bacterium]|nr:efflux RND transporter periplasmic adaptor subunit [Magnetococcales bacterium]
MRKSVYIALTLSISLVGWMASGQVVTAKTDVPERVDAAVQTQIKRMPRVQVTRSEAEPMSRRLVLRGQAQALRKAILRGEITGTVQKVAARRGARVEKGDLLMQLSMEDRQTRKRLAQARLKQSQADHTAAKSLYKKGFQADLKVKRAFADLQASRADLEAIKLEIRRTQIRAPFAGFLQERFVEQGEYVSPGAQLMELVDDGTILVTAHVPQQQVALLQSGQQGVARFLDGREVNGTVRYVAARADRETRSFRVELEIDNASGQVSAGASCELSLPVGNPESHKISPAWLTLDRKGRLAVKIVDSINTVRTQVVEIVQSDAEGVWITGLPQSARIITRGGGYVDHGQSVEPVNRKEGSAVKGDGHLS